MGHMATIIIPAHNESTVIRRCLDSVVNQQGVHQIIVACNGCTDNTVSIVQAYGDQVTCLELSKPSKVFALNEAEKLIQSWPVFYIDADTELLDGCIERVVQGMDERQLLLAAPEPEIRLDESSWLVKQYYKIWYQLPYIKSGLVGTCSFVLAQNGRERFDRFPDIISDDGFVRAQFEDHERGNVPGSGIVIQAPRNLKSLIKIKTRSQLGMMELRAKGLMRFQEQKSYPNSLSSHLFSKNWLAASVYIALALFMKLRARLQSTRMNAYQWETDHSSR